jgi:hypothetical protein
MRTVLQDLPGTNERDLSYNLTDIYATGAGVRFLYQATVAGSGSEPALSGLHGKFLVSRPLVARRRAQRQGAPEQQKRDAINVTTTPPQ